VLRYDDASRRLVLGLKYGDRLDGAAAFAEWMARAGADVLAGADMIVPVPLHWTRLFARRYNQAAVLALALGRLCGVAVMPDALVRVRRTPQQAGLSQKARWRNVRGAFRLRAGLADRLAGRRIVLIDDVVTTGATVEGCARALRRAGAGGVDVLSLARVVRPDQLPI
jgi:ComF family protein